jgi:membrane-associated phospholipid phosphatase
MMRFCLFFGALCLLTAEPLTAQQRTTTHQKVYKTSWTDGAISAAGIGISYWGLTIMNQKEPLSQEYLDWIRDNQQAAIANIPAFDRWSAGYYSGRASTLSDLPFYGSFAMPLVLAAATPDTRQDFWQIGLLYLETMSIAGSVYTQVIGNVDRNRPLVYNADPDNDSREDRKAQNSFFAGHTFATASASFFAAKVFNDYYPNSRAKPFVWAGAALMPATVGYLRLKAGKHFLSDNLLGYGLGAGIGFLVPQLHKINRNENFSMLPLSGHYDGLLVQYRF